MKGEGVTRLTGRVVREMDVLELGAVCQLTLAAYEEFSALMPPPVWARYRESIVNTLNTSGPAERIVALLEDRLVGSVLLHPASVDAYGRPARRAGYPEVRLLAVAPGARGLGIGKALMLECERPARLAGAAKIGLHTTDLMQTAMKMYERMGYVRVPDTDFTAAPGMLVKGYCLRLDEERPGP
jgi:GNAT superfamily N-acetyltransferase